MPLQPPPELIDVHCHMTPAHFPGPPTPGGASRWPCMAHANDGAATILFDEKPFRKLDSRSWDAAARLDDMDRDGIDIQVLSPMPELLSYWLSLPDAIVMCDYVNAQIAQMITHAPARFRGLGTVPLQDPERAALMLASLKTKFGLSGVEVGSNINGIQLGDRRFDPFFAAAQELDLAIFVHALHPLATQTITNGVYAPLVGFPVDVAVAVSSVLLEGVLQRFPGVKLAFSHGGGAVGAILGRLDRGWEITGGFGGKLQDKPSNQASRLFYDSNVNDIRYLDYLVHQVAPGRVFAGTDYPYDIMQQKPAQFLAGGVWTSAELHSLQRGAAQLFLSER